MKPKKRKTIALDGVYDIETANWDTFVCGGLLTRTGFRSFRHDQEERYVDEILACKGSLWAHNGGKYDALWFLQHVIKRKLTATVRCSGQRLISVQVGELCLRDSAALVPMSLEKAAKIGKVEKGETGLRCLCGQDCGGYCAIRRDMSEYQYNKMVQYLEQDCKATWSFLETIIEYAEEKDLDLCITVGASAYATASRMSNLPNADWSKVYGRGKFAIYNQLRQAYFGGRTQVFRPRAKAGHRYDINSAYPAALATLSLPVGEYHDLVGPQARKAYRNGKPGIFSASVRVPECFCPPLPIRCKQRIAYPTGSIQGTWTAIELAYAEECGARITDITTGFSWNASEMVLASFCRYIWSLRDQAGPKTPLGTWLKWYANSLTGKLAQRTEVETIVICPESIEATFCPADFKCHSVHPPQKCCKHECVGACGGYRQLAEEIYVRTSYRIGNCAHIQHAAYLTAHTRVTLHKQLVADGCDGLSACYCDTDSVIATEPREWNIGDALGQFKYEGKFEDFEAIAPKTYAYVDPDKRVRLAKAKGIPDAARHFDKLADGVKIDRGVATFRSAARAGDLFQRKNITRHVRGNSVWFGDRRLKDDGRTWPVDVSEMRE